MKFGQNCEIWSLLTRVTSVKSVRTLSESLTNITSIASGDAKNAETLKIGVLSPSNVNLSIFVSFTFLNEQVNIIAESKKSKVKIVETKPLKRKVTEDLSTSGKRYRLQKLSDVIDQGDLKLISEGHATNDKVESSKALKQFLMCLHLDRYFILDTES